MRCLATLLLLPLHTAVAAQHLSLLSGTKRALRSTGVRPIITGCLAECGTEEQSCVTQCQVCVEMQACNVLSNCSACLNEAREAKEAFRKLGNMGMDSGGMALKHEGVRQQLDWARLEAIDGKRKLAWARSNVLRAQRNAEWAEEERRELLRRLEQGKEKLLKTEEDVQRWDQRSTAKLDSLRARVRKLQARVNRTKQELAIAGGILQERQRAVQEAEDLAHAGAKARAAVVAARVVHQLEWKLQAEKEALRGAQEEYLKQQKDAGWFQRGLRAEVRTVARRVKQKAKDLHMSRETYQKSQEQLQQAKEEYHEAAQRSQNLTAQKEELQQLLLKIPLPTPSPSEARAGAAPGQ